MSKFNPKSEEEREYWATEAQAMRDYIESLKHGYIYLIKALEGNRQGLYKIGSTTRRDPQIRLEENRKKYGEIEVVCMFWKEYCRDFEAELHNRFSSRRHGNREWLSLEPGDIDYIVSLAERS